MYRRQTLDFIFRYFASAARTLGYSMASTFSFRLNPRRGQDFKRLLLFAEDLDATRKSWPRANDILLSRRLASDTSLEPSCSTPLDYMSLADLESSYKECCLEQVLRFNESKRWKWNKFSSELSHYGKRAGLEATLLSVYARRYMDYVSPLLPTVSIFQNGRFRDLLQEAK